MTPSVPDPSRAVGRLAFVALAGRVGVAPDVAAGLHEELVVRHGEPHRAYHSLVHVGWVLHHLGTTASELTDRRAVELAAWYHDAIHDPRRDDNEERSASLAADRLRAAGADPAVVADTVRLVRVTAAHRATRADEAALCDADLAVLGGDADGYAAYVRAVRSEYEFVDDAAWVEGRSAVLRSLLDLPRLYHHPGFAEREVQARSNLGRELAALETDRSS